MPPLALEVLVSPARSRQKRRKRRADRVAYAFYQTLSAKHLNDGVFNKYEQILI